MKKVAVLVASVAVTGILAAAFFAYQHGRNAASDPLDILAQMPADPQTVIFVDLIALKQSHFLNELYTWVPSSPVDEDYRQFVQSTGFNYETDLSRLSVAIARHGRDTAMITVADGRFDRKKISAYALQTGTRESRKGHEVFLLPIRGGARKIVLRFLRDDRIELASDASLDAQDSAGQIDADAQAWRERFRRLAGSPVFAVVRQDAAISAEFAAHAPGNFQSPQLSALIDQLQWITIAAKPENDRLRIVLEGESTAESTTRQLSEVVNALLELAQAGLNEPKTREQLQPPVREAYLEVLKSADVSRLDRGETKAVRLVFDVTPNFLEVARPATEAPSPKPGGKRLPAPGRGTIRN